MPFFLRQLKQGGNLEASHMTLVSVGSRKVSPDNDFGESGWSIFGPNLSIYGFDADADACDEANAELEHRKVNWNEQHVPMAIANTEGAATLYVTSNPMCSSLYPPNEAFLNRFANLPEWASLDFELELETTTLDRFCGDENINNIDFLQMDVQGGELQVLEGAREMLSRGILGIQTEVAFAELYLGQPLFCDVDCYLRDRHYSLFFLERSYRIRRNSPVGSAVRPGQMLWGDAFYFLDLLSDQVDDSLKTPERIFKLACIADMLEFPDYALELLEHLAINYGHQPQFNVADSVVRSFMQAKADKKSIYYFVQVFKRLRAQISDACAAQYNLDRLIEQFDYPPSAAELERVDEDRSSREEI